MTYAHANAHAQSHAHPYFFLKEQYNHILLPFLQFYYNDHTFLKKLSLHHLLFNLTDVPPAFDHYLQHEKMIKEGSCRVAEKNRYKNRYCNLFPFDRNLVQLEERQEFQNEFSCSIPYRIIMYNPENSYVLTVTKYLFEYHVCNVFHL